MVDDVFNKCLTVVGIPFVHGCLDLLEGVPIFDSNSRVAVKAGIQVHDRVFGGIINEVHRPQIFFVLGTLSVERGKFVLLIYSRNLHQIRGQSVCFDSGIVIIKLLEDVIGEYGLVVVQGRVLLPQCLLC